MAKLSDICDIKSGGTPSRAIQEYWNGTIPWVKISDFDGKYVDSTSEQITEEGLNNSSAKMIEKGSILFTIFATLGEVALLNIDATTNQAIAALTLNSPEVDIDYLYYFLTSLKKYVNKIGRGVAQNNINMSILRNIDVPLPNLSIQKQIASNLDKLTHIIDLCNQIIEKLNLLVKARFVEMFGDPVSNPMRWQTKPLLSIGKCKNGMNFHYDDNGVDINCLGVGNFKNLSIISDTSVLPKISLNKMPTDEYLLKNDDIVFVRSNGNRELVGRCLVVYPDAIPTTFSGFCIRFRKDDDSILIPYLLRVLKTDSVRKKMAGRGANIQNLNQQILSTLEIPVPPLELQEKFADFVEHIEKLKSAVKKMLEKAEILKKIAYAGIF